MKISVIIPTYNRVQALRECLTHLEAQTLNRSDFEVIVVNDGSGHETENFLSEFKAKTPLSFNFFVQPNSGAGVARNKGLSHAQGAVVLFLGDDIYAAPNLLEQHLSVHEKFPQKNQACLGFITWDPRKPITPLMKFLEKGGALFGKWGGGQFAYDLLEGKKTADWHFFYTSNISLKKSLLNEYRFDTDFKGYGWEDIDLGLRLTEKENLMLHYNSHAIAHHDHPQTLASFTRREYNVGKALTLFQSKHPHHKLMPSPAKKTVLRLLGMQPFLALWRLIWPTMYFYARGKRHFLKGVEDGILGQK